MKTKQIQKVLAAAMTISLLGAGTVYAEAGLDVSALGNPEEEETITYANFNSSGSQEETLAAMYEAFH